MASPSATTSTTTTSSQPKSPSIRVETITVSTETKSTEATTVIPAVLGTSREGRSPTKLTVTPPASIPSPPLTSSTTKATVPNTPTIIASSVPSSLKSPAFPSELPRSPMSATFSSLLPHTPGTAGGVKTPITPPLAYMDFLKNAIASPSDLKSPKFLPHHHPTGTGHASAGPSSPMFSHTQGSKRYRASLSGPSGGAPSPGLLGAHMQALAKANSASQGTKREHVYTPTHSSALSSARSSTSSLSSITSSSGTGTDSESVSRSSSGTSLEREPVPESSKKVVRFAESEDSGNGKGKNAEEQEEEVEVEDEDDVMEEVDCTRRQCINKDGTVTIKQVVTTTVTFKPRMSLMPAPKGKRRRIE